MNRKWNLQDIRPPEKRAPAQQPQDFERPHSDITRRPHAEQKKRLVYEDDLAADIQITDGNRSRRSRIIISAVIGILIIGAGIAASALMNGAEVTIYPKFKNINVQATFTAHIAPSAEDLGYELLTLEVDGERQVSAKGQEEVSQRATGNIFVYNEFSETPQRLIKNTRFESPDGLIYRIEESIEIPGSTTDTDGTIIPGIITATVFADGPGEQYNIEPSRFSVPGLKDTAQFDKIYAESTDTFNGGFEGLKFIINDNELETTKQALHTELRDALLERVEAEKPAGFILFNDAITFAYDTLPATQYGDDLATIKERARLQVPIFDEEEFATFIAENTIAGYEGNSVVIENADGFSFSYPDPAMKTADISALSEIEFTLAGNALVVWKYSEDELKNDILGLSKTALPTVLSGYPAIERAEAVVRPFWKQSFPTTPSEIELKRVVGDDAEN